MPRRAEERLLLASPPRAIALTSSARPRGVKPRRSSHSSNRRDA